MLAMAREEDSSTILAQLPVPRVRELAALLLARGQDDLLLIWLHGPEVDTDPGATLRAQQHPSHLRQVAGSPSVVSLRTCILPPSSATEHVTPSAVPSPSRRGMAARPTARGA